MKVVKNACYGGFGLSPKALKRIAELMGKELYFFQYTYTENIYKRLTLEEATEALFCTHYTVPNPEDYRLNERDADGLYKSSNERAETISLPNFSSDTERTNPMLIQAIEELGDEANTKFSKLKVVEIPDGTDYEISEYDGFESIEEKHHSW